MKVVRLIELLKKLHPESHVGIRVNLDDGTYVDSMKIDELLEGFDDIWILSGGDEGSFHDNRLDRDEPKKLVNRIPIDSGYAGDCPNCGNGVIEGLDAFCPQCGQRLDWKE